jgi:peptide/nickel transport system permease protein
MRPRRTSSTICGAGLLLLLVAAAAAAPWIGPYPPDLQDLSGRLQGPSRQHPLGRDDLGRDVLSRVLWGARVSLSAGVVVVLVAGSIGVLLGTAAGLAGGWLEAALMALVDLLLGFPGVLLAIALVAVLGPRLGTVLLALTIVGWVGYARLARSRVLQLKDLEYLQAARALGSRPARILLRHALPNLLGPVIVQAALGLGGVILAEAGLSFLGLGVAPPTPSWGGMLRSGTQNLLDAPLLTVVPGMAIFVAVLGANLLGEGLRERLDPRGRTGETAL